jgi:hypothetical protein
MTGEVLLVSGFPPVPATSGSYYCKVLDAAVNSVSLAGTEAAVFPEGCAGSEVPSNGSAWAKDPACICTPGVSAGVLFPFLAILLRISC